VFRRHAGISVGGTGVPCPGCAVHAPSGLDNRSAPWCRRVRRARAAVRVLSGHQAHGVRSSVVRARRPRSQATPPQVAVQHAAGALREPPLRLWNANHRLRNATRHHENTPGTTTTPLPPPNPSIPQSLNLSISQSLNLSISQSLNLKTLRPPCYKRPLKWLRRILIREWTTRKP